MSCNLSAASPLLEALAEKRLLLLLSREGLLPAAAAVNAAAP